VLRAVYKFDFRLFYTKHLTDSNDYFLRKLQHVVIEPHVFDRMYMFSPDRPGVCQETVPTLCRSNSVSWIKNFTSWSVLLNKPRYMYFTKIILFLFYSNGNCRKPVAINNINFISYYIPSWNLYHGWSFLSAARLARFSLHAVCNFRTLSCLLVVSKAVLTALCLLVFWWQKQSSLNWGVSVTMPSRGSSSEVSYNKVQVVVSVRAAR